MNQSQLETQSDLWSEWLLHRRHADDPEYDRLVRATIKGYADRVLDGAGLTQGKTLADIGSGEGLIAFGAIDRVGSSLRVLVTDVSVPMLRYAEAIATERGVRQQCTFIECSAEKLENIPSCSVDAVTTRAVLAYVFDKRAALREFHRILQPGGCLSIAEPIFRDETFDTIALKRMVDAHAPATLDPVLRLLHRWKAAQFPDTEEKMTNSPIANFSERDLVHFAHDAGFVEIRMAFHINILPSIITSWDVFLGYSPHPWAPSLRSILAKEFTAEERELLERVLRPSVESPQYTLTDRIAFLTAKKPIT